MDNDIQYFSQWGEDRWIMANLRLPVHGTFVEVGAHDGISGSNTLAFERIGWTGVVIEPGDNDVHDPHLSNHQYGRLKQMVVDADPSTVMTLVGEDGDMSAFIGNKINRTNTPGVYQSLTTTHQGPSGCTSCNYDPLGNVLTTVDARGNLTSYQRNELGEVYRVTMPAPYSYQVETFYDSNRNVTRVDTEDLVVQYNSTDPSDPGYARFTPTGNGTTRYVYNSNQCIEEQVDGLPTRQFVWGQYIDELVQMKSYVPLGSQPLPAGVYYLLSDLLYRSTALTDSTGAVVEAYDTDAYGNTLIYSGPGTDGLWFTDDDVASLQPACESVFTGRQYDPETQIYFYRARYYHPMLGRFINRDPISYRGGVNLYQYLHGNPPVYLDPSGL